MQTKAIILVTLASLHWSTTQSRGSEGSADAQFQSLAAKYVEEILRTNPEQATHLGDHRFDDRLNDYSLAGVRRQRDLALRYLKELAGIPLSNLSPVNQVDYRILRDRLNYQVFRIDELKEHEWNPLVYNVSGSINALLMREFAPLPTRLHSVQPRLAGIPDGIAHAKANLRDPAPLHTETALSQHARSHRLAAEALYRLLAK